MIIRKCVFMKGVKKLIKMLHLTSCLFATIVVHAYHLKQTAYHHLFLAVTVLSVLFHSTKSRRVGIIDKITAHFGFIMVLTDTRTAIERGKTWILAFPLWVVIFWFTQSLFPARAAQLHALLHLAVVAGMHAYLHELHSLN
jgi:hypothetical protein